MDFSTRTSSVRVCHFATSAGRGSISAELDLSLKFNVEKLRGRPVRFRLASFSRAAILTIIE